MTRFFLIISLVLSTSLSNASNPEDCKCEMTAPAPSLDKEIMQGLLHYADMAIKHHDLIINTAGPLLKAKQLEQKDRQAIQQARSVATKTRGNLMALKSRITKAGKMTKKQYGIYISDISSTSFKGVKATSMFFKKRPPKVGECDDNYNPPDCSSEAQIVGGACANGVQILASCGYYDENGGAAAMQDDQDACGMSQQSAMQMCLMAVNACQGYSGSMATRDFESDAYSTCAQFERDKLNQAPSQTETSTGR